MKNMERVNTGNAPNDGQGDTLREAFDKTNRNFQEIEEELKVKASETLTIALAIAL